MGKFIDLTGQTFGEWTVIKHIEGEKWLCRCSCGVESIVFKHNLVKAKICKHFKDLTGMTFGNWKVLNFYDKTKYNQCRFLCECQCENKTKKIVIGYTLTSGKSKDCGCGRIKTLKNKLTKSLVGQKFGTLTVISQADNINVKTAWFCLCNCGNSIIVKGCYLINGNIDNCGCISEIKTKKNCNPYEIKSDYVIMYLDINNTQYFTIDLDDFDKVFKYVWYVHEGYVVANNKGKLIRLNRIIMNVKNNDVVVDHKDHNPLNNRKYNLRICSYTNNNTNKCLYKNNTSGTTGVSFDKQQNKWLAYVNVNKERLRLGYFNNYNDAVKHRKEAEEKYYKEFKYDINNDYRFKENNNEI